MPHLQREPGKDLEPKPPSSRSSRPYGLNRPGDLVLVIIGFTSSTICGGPREQPRVRTESIDQPKIFTKRYKTS